MAETRSYEEIAKIAKKIQQEEENKMQFQVTRRMYETFSNEELQILANGSSDVSMSLSPSTSGLRLKLPSAVLIRWRLCSTGWMVCLKKILRRWPPTCSATVQWAGPCHP